MILPVILDIVEQTRRGDVLPAAVLGGYACLGVLIYVFYGMKRSDLVAANPVD